MSPALPFLGEKCNTYAYVLLNEYMQTYRKLNICVIHNNLYVEIIHLGNIRFVKGVM